MALKHLFHFSVHSDTLTRALERSFVVAAVKIAGDDGDVDAQTTNIFNVST